MKVWNDISKFEASNPVVTIGIFDGVHAGHLYLIGKMKQKAVDAGGETVVITLWPHPRVVLNKNPEQLRYLNTIEEKTALLERAGVDHLVIIPFTKEFSDLRSCEFVEKYLVEQIHLHHLIIGFNHKFGKDREGDYSNLKYCADQFGFSIEKLEPVEIRGETISSSLIRNLLNRGSLDRANRFLGYDYFLQGSVVNGNRIGRQIGFPTANITLHDSHKLLPADGVYAVNVFYREEMYSGMLNLGYRPTVANAKRRKTIEVNVFDLDRDMYDQDVVIYFRKRLRDEKKFENIEQLKSQLVKDREMAVEILSHLE
ncbi:MAG TPA: bifunctional riboflavin kinase/FAD synthetase [Bacteroidales bacterium]|nr:bifunctional riboflavin kinase/FAD synthetase [Bacteroidales bacterium]